ncbi:hypothetical protein GMOD_00009967 [Pyrenophora seminiperda CCB06]|uniref:Uncharacterized protein n=1 Tax=Pyrenophora seminiperda CCB06 TaxID=1302712 RepID=A0A3M7M1J8_9PLEO|nr:hypothetical protein GMOD_00009967 [Pyrenophora seminiperda CCB06]
MHNLIPRHLSKQHSPTPSISLIPLLTLPSPKSSLQTHHLHPPLPPTLPKQHLHPLQTIQPRSMPHIRMSPPASPHPPSPPHH